MAWSIANWIVNVPGAWGVVPPGLRRRIWRVAGANLGACRIMQGVTVHGRVSGVTIGDGTFLNVGCSLFSTGGISIGSNVSFGPGVLVMTGTHAIGPSEKRASEPTLFQSVKIEDGAWLGASVIVNPGVSVGAGCVVAPGAVVVRDCAGDGMYAGVPAVRKRDLGGGLSRIRV